MERSEEPGSAPGDDWLAALSESDAEPKARASRAPTASVPVPPDDWLTALHDDQAHSPVAETTQPRAAEPAAPPVAPAIASRRPAGDDREDGAFGSIFDDDDRTGSRHPVSGVETQGAADTPGFRTKRRWLKLDVLFVLAGGIVIGVLGAWTLSGPRPAVESPLVSDRSSLPTTGQTSWQDIVVSPGQGGQFASIGDAIAGAQPGSRVRVRPGTYQESLTLNKPVDIVGEGDAKEIIIEAAGRPCVVLKAETATLRNLTLRSRTGSSASEKNAAIDVPGGRLTVDGCDVTSQTQACLTVHGPKSYALVRQCTIHDGGDAGIAFSDKAGGLVDDCEIFGNVAPGVVIIEDSRPTIRKCHIHHGKQFGILVARDGRGTIVDCDIAANGIAEVCVKENGDPVVHGCTIREGTGNGFWFIDNGRGTVVRCEVFGHVLPDVSIGKESNPNFQYCTIRDGKRCGVHIYGGGRATLDTCEVLNSAFAGVQIEKESRAVVRSCTIRGGQGNGISLSDKSTAEVFFCDISGHAHPGVWSEKGASPTIYKCKIHHGKAEGIVITAGGQGTVTDSDIFENATTGVIVSASDAPTFQDSRINRNGNVGIRVQDHGTANVNSCNLDGNKGGAWSIDAESNVSGGGNSAPMPPRSALPESPRPKSANEQGSGSQLE